MKSPALGVRGGAGQLGAVRGRALGAAGYNPTRTRKARASRRSGAEGSRYVSAGDRRSTARRTLMLVFQPERLRWILRSGAARTVSNRLNDHLFIACGAIPVDGFGWV